MFKGEDGSGVQSTPHAEIKTWVKSMIVPEEAAQMQSVYYGELVADAMASNNPQMSEAFTEVVEIQK